MKQKIVLNKEDYIICGLGVTGLLITPYLCNETMNAWQMRQYLNSILFGYGTYFAGSTALSATIIETYLLKYKQKLLREHQKREKEQSYSLKK